MIASLLSPALISAGSFAINDYFDVEADRSNKRTDRPLVSGALKRKSALWIAAFCLAVGPLISLYINMTVFIIAVLFSVLAYLYSERLKDMLLVGNIYVAFTYAIPFIYGNFVVAAALSVNILLISLSIFLIGLAREIYGMIRDKEGDIAARKTKNLISCIGERRSAEFGLILTVEGIIISMYLFIYQTPFKFNLAFMLPITLANLLIFYIGVGHISHANSGSRKWFDRARNLSFVGMGIALLAYLLTGLGLYLII